MRDLSAFWALLVLAAVIASAGVVADSTATVIGAMIVAPLMRPILGTACAIVLADRRHLVTCVLLTLAGAATSPTRCPGSRSRSRWCRRWRWSG